jgi:ABC-2 type transport system permease protein
MNPIIGIAVKDTKTFFRERGTVFWTIAFPILILLLFTAIFGRDIPFHGDIGVIDNDGTDLTKNMTARLNWIGNSTINGTSLFSVSTYTDRIEAMRDLNASRIRALIIFPKNFTTNLFVGGHANVSMVVDGTNLDVAQLVRSGINAFFTGYYKAMNPGYAEPIVVNEEATVIGQKIGYKENIVPGMLTYPLLFSSMVVSTGAIVYEKEKGTLKKIRASPVRPMGLLAGKTLAALFQTAISILIMSTLAAVLLGPKLNWNIPLLFPVLLLGSVNGIALGLIISCIGRAPQEASNAATTVAIVLQFFTGMYFPIEYLPTYMQDIGKFIPMTYAAQALRDIMIRNATLTDLWMPLTTLIASAIILYLIGILLYRRWVEK